MSPSAFQNAKMKVQWVCREDAAIVFMRGSCVCRNMETFGEWVRWKHGVILCMGGGVGRLSKHGNFRQMKNWRGQVHGCSESGNGDRDGRGRCLRFPKVGDDSVMGGLKPGMKDWMERGVCASWNGIRHLGWVLQSIWRKHGWQRRSASAAKILVPEAYDCFKVVRKTFDERACAAKTSYQKLMAVTKLIRESGWERCVCVRR